MDAERAVGRERAVRAGRRDRGARTDAPLTRRGVLGAVVAAAGATGVSAVTGAGPAAAAVSSPVGRRQGGLAVRGADISFLPQLEAVGVRYRDRGRVRPLEDILAGHGANWVRLRVWVHPPAGYSDSSSALALARRAHRAGMKVLLDPHYSDFWADPGHQSTPAAWAGQDLATLAGTVRAYTRDLVAAFARQGTPVDLVQIGNEVTSGMLWPVGRIYAPDGSTHWPEFATLVRAGLAGVHDASPPGEAPRTMVQIDRGGDNGGTRWFFDHLLEQGVDFDVIGQSYYPFWHGPLSALQANLADTATRYGKDIIVVETAYPWTLENGDALADFVTSNGQLPDGARYPATPAGQLGFFEALRTAIAATPGGHGLGFMDWEPEWVPGVGWEPGAGNPNDNLTMFDFSGAALPSLRAFRR